MTVKAPTKTQATQPDLTESPKAQASAGLEIGDKVLLSAVYGDIINPNNETRFSTDRITPAVVDAWTQMQFEAGKLKLGSAD